MSKEEEIIYLGNDSLDSLSKDLEDLLIVKSDNGEIKGISRFGMLFLTCVVISITNKLLNEKLFNLRKVNKK